MPFNDKKCKVIAFGSRNYRPTTYKLGEAVNNWADMTTYLSVIMQSNLKFDQHGAQERQSFENFGSNQAYSKTSPTKKVTGLRQLVPPNTGVRLHCVGPNISQKN